MLGAATRAVSPQVTERASPFYKRICTAISIDFLLMCDKEVIEVQKILPFLSDTRLWYRIGRAVIRASPPCQQKNSKSQCSLYSFSVKENPPFSDDSEGRQHSLLSPLDYPPARTRRAVNGGRMPVHLDR